MNDKVNPLPKTLRAESGMSVYHMQQNGNAMQKKYAHIFDADANGVFNAKEAKLFNASSIKEEKDGNLTIWTSFTNGKKKTVMNDWSLKNDRRLKLENNRNKEYINNIAGPDKNYGSLEFDADGKYELTIGESCDPNGYCVVSGNITKFYSEKNHLTGSIEYKDGREYYKDSKGNVLYSLHRESGSGYADDMQYFDSKNRLRYEIVSNDYSSGKLTISEYSEKGELIKEYNNCYYNVKTFSDPHEDFRPLKDEIEECYFLQEE